MRTCFTGLALLALGACADDTGPRPGEIGFVPGFYGAIAADEPNAVLVARDALTAGGSAADGAVALAFALTVSYPVGASLGSSGVCVVHDPGTGFTEALDFIAPAGQGADSPQGDRPAALPGLPRGMAALHARYGRMPWGQLITPAERMARFGHSMSRALNSKLATVAGPLFADPGMRATFSTSGAGTELIPEGRQFLQPDLGSVLGRIRLEGAGSVYIGPMSARLIESYNAAGGAVSPSAWRSFVAQWRRTVSVPVGNDLLHVAPPPAGGGITLAQLWALSGDLANGGDPAARLGGFAELSRKVFAARAAWLGQTMDDAGASALVSPATLASIARGDALAGYAGSQDTGSGTGFTVVDRNGMAVACSLTNFNPFGTGRIAPGTGVTPAAAPGKGPGRDAASLTAGIISNPHSLAFRFAIAGGEGTPSAVAAAEVLDNAYRRSQSLQGAMNAPRAFNPGVPNILALEPEAGETVAQSLRAAAARVEVVPALGRVQAVWCPSGLPIKDTQLACDAAHDPRGHGLSSIFQQQ